MPATPQKPHEKPAQKKFTSSEQSENAAKQARKKERTSHEMKTAKLRDLRLAKEAAEKEAADKIAAEKGEGKTAVKRAPRQRKRAPIRMFY